MLTPEAIRSQIERITGNLIELSLCSYQNYPLLRTMPKDEIVVSIENTSGLSIVMKNQPYRNIYDILDRGRMYNVKMVDGALIQLMYRFRRGSLESHRLAFFPSPYLEEFQNNPQIYEEDEIYAEVIARNIVPFPFRFDFDNRNGVVVPQLHPQSHLSLGQYQNCRIPVTAPITPYYFMSFVLRNFYNTVYKRYCDKITIYTDSFPITIAESERELVHIQIPVGT